MRNKKKKSQNTFPPLLPSSQAQLHSRFSLPPSPEWCRGTGNGGCSHFITPCVCCSFSLSSPASMWGPIHRRQSSMNFSNVGPSHRLQFFMSCSSVGPSHGVQSFRNRLLQRWSTMGSQVLPANLLQLGLHSPWVHRSFQDPAPARALSLLQVHPPAPVWGPPRAAGGYLLHRGPPWAAGAQPASPWSSPQAVGESPLLCLEYLLSLLLH